MSVFPAPAGVIRLPRFSRHRRCSFPRTCGGDPVSGIWCKRPVVVFPAPAGVILSMSCKRQRGLSFPRTCGGDPMLIGILAAIAVFSPHLRG